MRDRRITKLLLWLIVLLQSEFVCPSAAMAAPPGMARISQGNYLPLFSISEADPKGFLSLTSQADKSDRDLQKIKVGAFFLDQQPVTNEQFAEFVRNNPAWNKVNVKRIFAEKQYLAHLPSSKHGTLDSQDRRAVVNVSWFAAKAYCQWKGKRLTTLDEWEYVASRDVPLGRDRIILDWYARPSTDPLPEVGHTFRGAFGVWDMHGVVWEWVSDFNSALVTGESRGDNSLERSLFCGASSVGSTRPEDYTTFMRYALRNSLKANYTLPNVGFRCARNSGGAQ